MLNILGSFLVFSACTAIGFSMKDRFKQRLKTIDNLTNAIDLFILKISYQRTPIEEIIDILSLDSDKTTSKIFKAIQKSLHNDNNHSFSYCWYDGFKNTKNEISINDAEIEIMCEASMYLGKFDAEQQLVGLENTRKKLIELRKSANEDLKIRGTLYKNCATAIGIMAVLILI